MGSHGVVQSSELQDPNSSKDPPWLPAAKADTQDFAYQNPIVGFKIFRSPETKDEETPVISHQTCGRSPESSPFPQDACSR